MIKEWIEKHIQNKIFDVPNGNTKSIAPFLICPDCKNSFAYEKHKVEQLVKCPCCYSTIRIIGKEIFEIELLQASIEHRKNLTIEEVCSGPLLNEYDEEFLLKMIDDGEFPYYRGDNNEILFDKNDVNEWVKDIIRKYGRRNK